MADSSKDAVVVAPAKSYVVKAEATVVHVNTVDERYLYRGAVVPENVSGAEVARLVDLGLVEEAPVSAPVEA